MSSGTGGPVYRPGDQVNGHVWTGTEWLPIAHRPPPAGKSVWLMLSGIVCLIVAGIVGLQALWWLVGFVDLDNQGNQFAGLLALLGMGAGVVAVGFGVAGVVLLKK